VKILFVSYSDGGGGAAKAIFNLYKSFRNISKNKLLVIDKRERSKKISLYQSGFIGKVFRRLRYLIAQFIFLNQKFYVMSLNLIDSGLSKYINNSPYEIVNLHWVNCETISLSEIKKINKPIVWTLHDMWPISGIYHYDLDKKYFNNETTSKLKKKYFNFLDKITKKRKHTLFNQKKIHLISPSKWLLDEAKKTKLPFGEMVVIPNPINILLYKKSKDLSSLKKKYKIPNNKKILLYSSLKLDDKRKGFNIIKNIIKNKKFDDHIFIFFGINNSLNKINFKKNIIFINETYNEKKIKEIYSIADVLLFPSLIDNFPNTLLEAMSCNLPCVAFNCYGMKEIITHKKNGYLAKPYSTEDFRKGIEYVLLNKKKFSSIRKEVVKNYSYKKIKNSYNRFFDRI
jgi:glycosyltransferase involved in cell wall biosynthesis